MSDSQSLFPGAEAPAESSREDHSISFVPESVWAISVVTPRPSAPPAEELADDEIPKEPWLPSWFPSAVEGVWGLVVGATVGALILSAVVLDHEDTVPAAVLHPRATHQVAASAHRPITIAKPAFAPARAATTEETTPARPMIAKGGRRPTRR